VWRGVAVALAVVTLLSLVGLTLLSRPPDGRDRPVPLSLTAEANLTAGQAPLAVGFTASALGGDGTYTWAWDFGDGGMSTLKDPSHTFAPGTFSVIATVRDGGGNTASITLSIAAFARIPVMNRCTIEPTSATLGIGGNAYFSVRIWNGTLELPLSPWMGPVDTWSTSGDVGTIFSMSATDGSGGLFTATAAGTGTVTALVSDHPFPPVTCTVPITVLSEPHPWVTITRPTYGTAENRPRIDVEGISGNATRVEVRVNGGAWTAASQWTGPSGTTFWGTSVDLSPFLPGNVSIDARGSNETLVSGVASVRINWLLTAPTIEIASPEWGSTVLSSFTLGGTATNATRVEVSADGENTWIAAQGAGVWEATFEGLPTGTHMIVVRAFGPGGMSDAVLSVTVAEPGFPLSLVALVLGTLGAVFLALVWKRRRGRSATWDPQNSGGLPSTSDETEPAQRGETR